MPGRALTGPILIHSYSGKDLLGFCSPLNRWTTMDLGCIMSVSKFGIQASRLGCQSIV